MPSRRRERPIESYEEYLRTYLPRDAENDRRRAASDPGEAGEHRAKEAVDKAVAQLTSSDE
jgi:hypothetical protein